jgi:hypothetical protein
LAALGVIDRHGHAAIGEQLPERGVNVNGVSAQEPHSGAGLEHRRVEAEAAAVDEAPRINASDIDSCGVTGGGECGDLVVAMISDAKSLREIVTGSRWYDCQRAVGAGCDERMGDTTAGTITADDGDRRPAFFESLAR